MKKLILLTVFSLAVGIASTPVFAQAQAPAKNNKVKKSAKAVERGVMWGPKKVGAGLKKVGHGAKNLVHKDNK